MEYKNFHNVTKIYKFRLTIDFYFFDGIIYISELFNKHYFKL